MMVARILIVEDNKVSLELAEYLLQAFGYTTSAARNGEEGIRIARQQYPDLVLCDLQMPVMDGYAVMREMKNDPLLCRIPVIAVTALSMPGDKSNVMAAGFHGYVSKPIDPESFVGTIEQFVSPELRARGVAPGVQP